MVLKGRAKVRENQHCWPNISKVRPQIEGERNKKIRRSSREGGGGAIEREYYAYSLLSILKSSQKKAGLPFLILEMKTLPIISENEESMKLHRSLNIRFQDVNIYVRHKNPISCKAKHTKVMHRNYARLGVKTSMK